MEPVSALQQAIHYLDRELAPGQKVRAFRNAIDVVVEVGPAEVAARATAGTLTELDGIGKSTAEVIVDALDDNRDGYLARLDERSRIPMGEGEAVMAALRGDAGGFSSHYWETPAITVEGSTVRLKGRTFLASPGAFRLRMEMSVGDEPFSNYGTVWWERVESER